MPELPEVETIRIGLAELLPGLSVRGVNVLSEKNFQVAPGDVQSFVAGAKIKKVRRRAKILIIDLSTNYSLVIHLKMTGQLVFCANDGRRFGAGHPTDSLVGTLPDRSTRVELKLDGASLYFNDQRKFGWIRLLPTSQIPEVDFIKKLGPEPLAADFSATDFIVRLSKRPGTSIKAALLDQTVIAGVGNIYTDESLWGARLHPATLVRDLTERQMELLLNELKKVLELSIRSGGSTDRNYVDANGKKGSYLNFARVFRREGLRCPRCDTIILKTRVAGRGTHYCPRCQRDPRSKDAAT